MAKVITKKNGKQFTLLNPGEKSRKFAEELRTGARFTNDGEPKFNDDGRASMLTDTQSAYRSGYLDARKDSAGMHKWKKKKGYL